MLARRIGEHEANASEIVFRACSCSSSIASRGSDADCRFIVYTDARTGRHRPGGKDTSARPQLNLVQGLDAGHRGGLFVMEETNRGKGGPSQHFHHGEDELFYVLEGEYVFQVGAERFRLKAGDSVLGPRGIPHAFAFAGESSGRLLISYAPAGKMETLFNEITGITPPGKYANEAELLHAYGMELTGPPIFLG